MIVGGPLHKARKMESAMARIRAGLEAKHFPEGEPRPSEEVLTRLFDMSLASTFDWAVGTKDTEEGTKAYYDELAQLMKWKS